MQKFERFIVLYALVYMAVYIPFFFLFSFVILPRSSPELFFRVLLPLHVLGMAQNLIALILTIRDLYLRSFPQPNQKLTWGLLIVATGGVGWIVYVFKYALKARSSSAPV